MGSNMSKITSGHGLSGSGKGHPPTSGVTGAGGKFVGTTTPQDVDRTSISDKGEVGEVGSKKVPSNVGIKPHKTGGMSRKDRGVIGSGGYKGTT